MEATINSTQSNGKGLTNVALCPLLYIVCFCSNFALIFDLDSLTVRLTVQHAITIFYLSQNVFILLLCIVFYLGEDDVIIV